MEGLLTGSPLGGASFGPILRLSRDCGFIEQIVSKSKVETGPELPIKPMGVLGSVLQQPDSGTVAKQQKEKAIKRHNGTQKPILHIKKTWRNEMKENLHSVVCLLLNLL